MSFFKHAWYQNKLMFMSVTISVFIWISLRKWAFIYTVQHVVTELIVAAHVISRSSDHSHIYNLKDNVKFPRFYVTSKAILLYLVPYKETQVPSNIFIPECYQVSGDPTTVLPSTHTHTSTTVTWTIVSMWHEHYRNTKKNSTTRCLLHLVPHIALSERVCQ
jgi:hypothetical protein